MPKRPLFLLAQFRRELFAEILHFEHLADFDLGFSAGHRIWAALDPLDGLFFGFHLPQPVAGDQFLGFGEGAVDHRALVAREAHAGALAAGVQAFARDEDAGLGQFFVVIAHGGQQFVAGHDAGFGVLTGFDDDHESHGFDLRWF